MVKKDAAVIKRAFAAFLSYNFVPQDRQDVAREAFGGGFEAGVAHRNEELRLATVNEHPSGQETQEEKL